MALAGPARRAATRPGRRCCAWRQGLFDDAALLAALQHQLARRRAECSARSGKLVTPLRAHGRPAGRAGHSRARLYAARPSSPAAGGDGATGRARWRRRQGNRLLAPGHRQRRRHPRTRRPPGEPAGGAGRHRRRFPPAAAGEGPGSEATPSSGASTPSSPISARRTRALLLAYDKLIAGGKAGEADYAALLGVLRESIGRGAEESCRCL
ncbi:MAG: hypothetical protein MZV65_43845, partial [Chromatiales bacterium]|nr:hypothetical protein [Chromatiales bacterium]